MSSGRDRSSVFDGTLQLENSMTSIFMRLTSCG